ncbi:MAG: tRNA modification GTPase [Blastocatellia bacterium]|nr:tRNA modification GTPase [Blastocatellia bacterium]
MDTIAALSTPPGRSGIGVIRLSGPQSLELARRLMRDPQFTPEPNQVVLKSLHDLASGELLDRALVTYFKAPHSFTGEDVVELSCHGSPVLLRQLLDLILSLDARPAGPGEFTLRALSNGRLNLSQAEAVRDLINAQTGAAARQAARQMNGELSTFLQPVKEALLDIIVPLESSLEFVEDDLPDLALDQLTAKLSDLIARVEKLAATFHSGRLLRDGLKVTLVGRPNVGKSSLFNSLLVSDRAIVTDVPGTTRDTLSEVINVSGIPVQLTDTAGVRPSSDQIEALGVERSRRSMADADILVVVFDNSRSLTPEVVEVLAEVSDSLFLIVHNKSDLPPAERSVGSQSIAGIHVSAKTGAGLKDLSAAIIAPFAERDSHDTGLLITDARHHDLLRRTQSALTAALESLSHRLSEELILVGLYDALRYLGEITGETTPDDVLSQIFMTFCIGK